jgi:polyisoprenoid-binding protein YceI
MGIRMTARLCLLQVILFCCAFLATIADSTAASHWAIDPARTHINFEIDAVAFPRTHGEFKKFSGGIAVDFDHPERSRVEFHVDAASAEVGSPEFSSYVRSEALLNAPHFPTIEFVSTSVRRIDERTVRVTGNLTMLGVIRPLDVEVDVQGGADGSRKRLGFVAKARIDRLDFGMTSGYPVIARDVDLVISSEAYQS